MPVQSDLNIAIDAYIQSNFTGTLAEISALKLPLERLLVIQRSLGSPSVESGFLNFRNTALTNTAIQVKATAGQTRGWNLINLNTVAVYVKLYDALAVNVVIGTTAVVRILVIPSGSVFFLEAQPVAQDDFATAISIACVTDIADSNTTAPTIPIYAAVRYK